jgi:hypothetical protein
MRYAEAVAATNHAARAQRGPRVPWLGGETVEDARSVTVGGGRRPRRCVRTFAIDGGGLAAKVRLAERARDWTRVVRPILSVTAAVGIVVDSSASTDGSTSIRGSASTNSSAGSDGSTAAERLDASCCSRSGARWLARLPRDSCPAISPAGAT